MSLFKSRKERKRQKLEEQREVEAEKRKAEVEKEAKEKEKKELIVKSLSYIFTISASDYVRSRGRDLSDYDLRCVFAEEYRNDDALGQMTRKGIAIGAEAIVDVRPSHNTWYRSSDLFLIGTALIPKYRTE